MKKILTVFTLALALLSGSSLLAESKTATDKPVPIQVAKKKTKTTVTKTYDFDDLQIKVDLPKKYKSSTKEFFKDATVELVAANKWDVLAFYAYPKTEYTEATLEQFADGYTSKDYVAGTFDDQEIYIREYAYKGKNTKGKEIDVFQYAYVGETDNFYYAVYSDGLATNKAGLKKILESTFASVEEVDSQDSDDDGDNESL